MNAMLGAKNQKKILPPEKFVFDGIFCLLRLRENFLRFSEDKFISGSRWAPFSYIFHLTSKMASKKHILSRISNPP